MNRLFLVAITGECCMFALHGIKPRHYNPFVLLKEVLAKEGVNLNTKNRVFTLEYLEQLFKDNKMDVHKLLPEAIKRLKEQKAAKKTKTPETEA